MAKKDVSMEKHPKLADKNVSCHAMQAMQSLKPQGYWREGLPGDIFTGTLPTGTASISIVITLCPLPEIVPAIVHSIHLVTEDWLKDLEGKPRVRLTQGSQ